jgi:hypothetical protein
MKQLLSDPQMTIFAGLAADGITRTTLRARPTCEFAFVARQLADPDCPPSWT